MIHSKQTYVKDNKKLLRKVHSKWTVVSVALLSMIGLGGLSVHQANADSGHANQDPNIVTSWTPKVANIQSQKAVTNASQNSSNISSSKTANFGAKDEQSQTQLNTNDSSKNSSNSQNQARKPVAAQIPKENLSQAHSPRVFTPTQPYHVLLNVYDQNTNKLIYSQLDYMMRHKNEIADLSGGIKTSGHILGYTVPAGTNMRIRLNYNNGESTTDPSTGFTKQPDNTEDVASPNMGWHVYLRTPYDNKVGTSATITGDFSNYRPLYDIKKLASTLYSMGINNKDIFPYNNSVAIPGFLGNRLPSSVLNQVNKSVENRITHLINEFNSFSPDKQQAYNKQYTDPGNYYPKTRPNDPSYNQRSAIISAQTAVQNQNYINNMFPDIAAKINNLPNIAERITVGKAYTAAYIPAFVNYVLNIANHIKTIYLGNAKNLTSTQAMFCGLQHLKSVYSIGNFDTGQVTDMADMFNQCTHLNNIKGLSEFNTSNVYDMQNMFYHDINLINISPLAWWNTHNLYNAGSMFSGAFRTPGLLRNLKPLQNWDTSNLMDLGKMFSFQPHITDISPIANWKLSDYAYGFNGMFMFDMNINKHPNWNPTEGNLIQTLWYYHKNKNGQKVSYPINIEQNKFNHFIQRVQDNKYISSFAPYFKLSFDSNQNTKAQQLRSPDRKQDTDYVNFYANGEHLGVAKVHGLDGSNINVSPLGGYMLDPNTHLLFNNGQHRMDLIPLNSPENNLETLNVPVSLDATAPSNTPSHNATPANSNNTPTNHQSPDDNTGNSSRRQGADNENNGSDSQDHNTDNSHTAGVNNNNNERRGNAAGGGAGGDSNNNPSNNIAGGKHGNVVNNNDHGNQGNYSNYSNAAAEAFAGTIDEHDRNDNQLIDMTDNDMNAALARQQNQEDQNQNYWVNEFKDVDNLATLIQQQHVEDENQAQIRQFNFDQKMAALQKQVTTSFTNPLNQMMNSLN